MSTQLDSLRRFLARRERTAHPGGGGNVVVVGGGRGGLGTSSIAALLALVWAADGHEVLLVDADDNLGTLHLLLGTPAGKGIGALRDGSADADDLVVPVAPGLGLLTAHPPETDEPAPTGAERRALVRRLASIYPKFDRVVIDGGSRLESVTGACASGASTLLALTAADRVSLAATHALVKASTARVPGLDVRIAANRTSDAEAKVAFEILHDGVARFLGLDLAFLGAVPDDPDFHVAMTAGATIQDAAARAAIVPAVRDIAGKLHGHAAGAGRRAPQPALAHTRR